MKITNIKRIKLKDGSNDIYYTAIIDGKKLVRYRTSDGPFSFHPHISKKQFKEMIIKHYGNTRDIKIN